MTARRLEPTTTYFVNEHSTISPNWPNDWAELGVLICTVHLTLPSYHVTYAFQREFTLYIRLDAKELLAQNRRDIWSLSDCKETRTHNQLFRKRTLNHLVKLTRWLSWVVSTISVRCIWLYLLIVSRTHFRPSPEFIFAWMLRNSLLQTVAISEI